MEQISPSKFLILLFCLTCVYAMHALASGERKAYIVHMDKSAMPSPFAAHDDWYTSMLTSMSSADGELPAKHLYTYNHVLHGFSAVLSPSQLKQLERMPGHLATLPDSHGKLHTTRTPKFLGLDPNSGLWPAANFGDDVIIGILDTGIWPESKSFDDKGFPPIPDRWKGQCETGTQFNSSNCNRKLIGARSFSKGLKESGLNISSSEDYDSPRDFYGHGTHTSSTAAGVPVSGADYFGYAKGTAVGMAPKARLAMYKVGFATDTFESAAIDVLAGMDQAIADGVDVMSMSLGFFYSPYYDDIMAIGAFAAMEKGIFVACSAGNGGAEAYTVLNSAPWITTVGASTVDRALAAELTFGSNGTMTLVGSSMFPENLYVSMVPLYYGSGNSSEEACEALDPKEVAGKVVLCGPGGIFGQIDQVNRSGAFAAILATDDPDYLFPSDFYMPIVTVWEKDSAKIREYITMNPDSATVDIKFQITLLDQRPAPQVAFFSSRGPSLVSPWILKPDVIGPGHYILAAWASNKGRTRVGNEFLMTDYALDSGTSMSCPHVAGIAALIKAAHRDWSPAAIRSALMTTAYITDNTNGPILDMFTRSAASPLDFGSGHVDPNKALDPGLVYDIEPQEYVNFLCGINYTSQQIRILTKTSIFSCVNATLDLNYPSFTLILNKTKSASSTFTRTLTSVSDQLAVYQVAVQVSKGVNVTVVPETLTFDKKNSKRQFTVSIAADFAGIGTSTPNNKYTGGYGYLSWIEIDGKHVVRSPIMAAYAP